jgi:2-keto-4-pentenoate hydratase/2-oxohepta-3-ene-1,7-dioic acid hydratase in catechol pathway
MLCHTARKTGETVMRWARFERNGTAAYGMVEGDKVQPVTGSPFGEWAKSGGSLKLSDVKLLVPVVPTTFYACGLNYEEHIRAVAEKVGQSPNLPTQPDVGYRANNALIAQDEAIVIPRDATDKVQYEGELVVVIGKTAKNLSEADALSCVLGYTIGNDVSERSWQKQDRTLWRAKNTDTFKPMGPWIETELKLPDLVTKIRLNGKELIQFPTNHMIFGVEKFIATMSRYLTLHPGDVIWMGTEGETADMKHGDTVEVEITGIGTLRTRIVDET